MLTAIILDDEIHGAKSLRILINKNCPDVHVIYLETDPLNALISIKKFKPDILFLDIDMPKLNGFEVLSELSNPLPKVIFTTAYDEYAIQAFKFNAIDYLLKPVMVEDLVSSVNKANEKISVEKELRKKRQIEDLRQNQNIKISVHCRNELIIVETHTITRLEADSNYTHIYTVDGRKITSAKTLKEYEHQLPVSNFYRIHKTIVINMQHVEKFVRGEDAYIIMKDKSCLEISRRRKTDFLLYFYKNRRIN